jgi:hypothetical protein
LYPLLEAAKQEKTVPFVIVYADPGAQKSVDDLLERGLLDKDNVKVWVKNFEEDNFSEEEIIDVVNDVLREDGFSLPRNEIDSTDREGTLWGSLEKEFYTKYRISIKEKISKPEIALKLIQPRLTEIRTEVKVNKYKPKLEIEKVLLEAYDRIFHSPIF